MRILLSSISRRGYLVRYFRESLGSVGQVWGGDCSSHAPALYGCDRAVLLPQTNSPSYVDDMLELCRRSNISIIVPLIDPELEVLAAQRQRFFDAGIMVVVSTLQTVKIGFDKYLTYQFGVDNDIPVPQTVISIAQARQLLDDGSVNWPLVVKPRTGSASSGISYCHNLPQLEVAFENCPSPMIQEFIEGKEYGYDIFSDKQHRPISVFCKYKITMRAGETDKAVSTVDPDLIALGVKIAQALELFGPMDVDVIVDKQGPKLLEINPRIGGGYPCSHLAGADFTGKLIRLAKGEELTPDIGSCRDGFYMFKQDEVISCTQHQVDSIGGHSDK